ncbi:hypothetical protein BH23BAC3_BH23BAC3_05860 [soil metagenome]
MKQLYIILISCCLILSGVSCNGDSEVETTDTIPEVMPEVPRLMMQPGNEFLLTPVGHLTEEYRTPEHLDREAVRSFIFVQSTDSISVMREYQQGKLFRLSLDEDLQITAQINRNQAMGERIRNLSASILDPYEGVVTLALEEARMTGNIDLVIENRLFHLRYDSLSGLHYLAEIEREKLDVIEGDDPFEFE